MTSSLEDIKQIDLEEWLTLATAPSSTKLKQGQSPDMKNVWVDEKPGSVITANGTIKVGQIPSGNPVSFCINYFKTSSGSQTFVVSDNSTVWTTTDFQNFTSIVTGLSSSFQLRGKVIRDKLWLTNGSDSVRNYDGTTVTVLDGTGGTPNVPKGRYIEYHDERIWLYHTSSTRSAVYFSALTDASGTIINPDNASAWPAANFLQISEGDADYGTGMIIYRGYLFLFKQYSIWRLVGYDEYTYSRVKTRSSTGTRFNESVQILDSMVHIIGVDGIYVFDGEESERVSDIIDPATASQTAFGFNDLQQPNSNQQFWEVTATADWSAGTVAANLAVDNSITLSKFDDSQTDFQAGVTQTNLDLTDSPGNLQLSVTSSGASTVNVASGQSGTITPIFGTGTVGVGSMLTDGDTVNPAGFSGSSSAGAGDLYTVVPSDRNMTTIKLVQLNASTSHAEFYNAAGTQLLPSSVTGTGATISTGSVVFSGFSQRDITVTFPAFTTTQIRIRCNFVANTSFTVTELQVFTAAFNTTGKFTSRTLDLGLTPASLGTFSAIETLNSQTTAYFTQSSVDGSSWDAEVSCTNGGSIGSTARRYLRWGVNLTSTGSNTPVIDATYLPSVYISAIHNTGGSIFSWGPVESDYSLQAQTISFYYRTATTSPGISGATWNVIVPGGSISDSTLNVYVQFKIEISGGDETHQPSVTNVTINWVKGTGIQAQTLQNVASMYWRNRYWLSAAGPSATANDTILIRGKKTFKSPWMLKDWQILSFTRYQDSLYGGSSTDGSIYKLDTGYSLAGSALDSYFETGDFVFGGFTAQLLEIDVEVERSGNYNLDVGVSVDGGNTFDSYLVDLTPSTYDNNYIKRINTSYTTTRFRLRFRTDGVDEPFQVHRCVAYYKLSVERGSIIGDYQ